MVTLAGFVAVPRAFGDAAGPDGQGGLTQVQVAKWLGRSQTWLSKCELGERRVDFVELEDLAAAYKVPLNFFRTRSRR